jgi:hypothetical protein
MTKLLIDDYPLVFLPTLAVIYGLNDAIVIQQIHYWSQKNKPSEDGFVWVYNTIPGWNKQFPFWSEKTIFSILKRLRDREVLIAEKKDENPWNHTLYYRLDYTKFGLSTSQELPDRSRKVYENTVNTETTRYIDHFDDFWKAYPRKTNKANALRTWAKLKPSSDLAQTMINAVKDQDLVKIEQQFIPHASTWLNGRRWEDEVDAKPKSNLKYYEKGYQP